MRVFNFAAGPAALPLEVLEQARDELTDWRGSGMSVMEISHRSKAFLARGRARPRRICASCWRFRPLQGAVPAGRGDRAVLGHSDESGAAPTAASTTSIPAPGRRRRSARPSATARSMSRPMRRPRTTPTCRRRATGSSRPARPTCTTRRTRPSAGSSFRSCRRSMRRWWPTCPRPSCRGRSMSSRFGLIYAGAQKNIGPAGLCVVIVREELLGHARARHAQRSGTSRPWPTRARCSTRRRPLPGTSPAWCSSGSSARADWRRWRERNRAKAELLYRTIDESGFYRNPVDPACRSWMNVPFTAGEARSSIRPSWPRPTAAG